MTIEHPRPLDSYKEEVERIQRIGIPGDAQVAQVFFVLVGEQPAVDVFFDEPSQAHTASEELQRLGLVVLPAFTRDGKGREISLLCVARNRYDAAALVTTIPQEGVRIEHEQYGRLMGFPQTAIDAFLGRIPRLSHEEQAAVDDSEFAFHLIYSKDHWKDERAFLRQRTDVLKKIAPDIYARLMGSSEPE